MHGKLALGLLLLNLVALSIVASCSDPIRNDDLMDPRMALSGLPFPGSELNNSLLNASGVNALENQSNKAPLAPTPGFPVPEKDWSKAFGGTNTDYSYSVQETSDGGYVIAGSTDSYGAGDLDVWLVKTDSAGTKLWDKTFGGANYDSGQSVQETSDGGYVIAGYTDSYGAGDLDVWLVKTDSAGTKLWDKTFGGTNVDYGYSVQETSDGGYVIAGSTYSYGAGGADVWLVKTDSAGTKLWDKTFGGTDLDYGQSVQETSDGGYVIAGYTYSYGAGGADVWLVKTDSAGTKLWDKTFGGANYDSGQSVQETSDGGYVIAGDTRSYGAGSYDVWLIKTDSSGHQALGQDLWRHK